MYLATVAPDVRAVGPVHHPRSLVGKLRGHSIVEDPGRFDDVIIDTDQNHVLCSHVAPPPRKRAQPAAACAMPARPPGAPDTYLLYAKFQCAICPRVQPAE